MTSVAEYCWQPSCQYVCSLPSCGERAPNSECEVKCDAVAASMMCIMKCAMHFTLVRVYIPTRILQNCKVWGVPLSISVQLHGERAPNTEFQAESDVPDASLVNL